MIEEARHLCPPGIRNLQFKIIALVYSVIHDIYPVHALKSSTASTRLPSAPVSRLPPLPDLVPDSPPVVECTNK